MAHMKIFYVLERIRNARGWMPAALLFVLVLLTLLPTQAAEPVIEFSGVSLVMPGEQNPAVDWEHRAFAVPVPVENFSLPTQPQMKSHLADFYPAVEDPPPRLI